MEWTHAQATAVTDEYVTTFAESTAWAKDLRSIGLPIGDSFIALMESALGVEAMVWASEEYQLLLRTAPDKARTPEPAERYARLVMDDQRMTWIGAGLLAVSLVAVLEHFMKATVTIRDAEITKAIALGGISKSKPLEEQRERAHRKLRPTARHDKMSWLDTIEHLIGAKCSTPVRESLELLRQVRHRFAHGGFGESAQEVPRWMSHSWPSAVVLFGLALAKNEGRPG